MMAAHDPFERYSRQMLVAQLGREGQEKLSAARVGLVGCGALGSVVAGHLVRAGVGYLRIIDDDRAELHNLHRQNLYTESDVARRVPKAEAAVAHLKEVNSEVAVEGIVARLTEQNLASFAGDLDLIVDGTDNFRTRFMVNEYCVAHDMPWVYGGVVATSGMTLTVVPREGPCLRCLVREEPGPGQSPTADVAGVLNTVVAVIGSLEASEVVKLIVAPESRSRDLLVVDVWDSVFEKLQVPRDSDCACCGRPAAGNLEEV
jgi:molybdopterin/thiamine biosynthesis adenylyltransferase